MAEDGPAFWIARSGPGATGSAGSMVMSLGSSRNDHTSRKALLPSRFLTTTWTGRSGMGKRRDSEKVRAAPLASEVVSHSP